MRAGRRAGSSRCLSRYRQENRQIARNGLGHSPARGNPITVPTTQLCGRSDLVRIGILYGPTGVAVNCQGCRQADLGLSARQGGRHGIPTSRMDEKGGECCAAFSHSLFHVSRDAPSRSVQKCHPFGTRCLPPRPWPISLGWVHLPFWDGDSQRVAPEMRPEVRRISVRDALRSTHFSWDAAILFEMRQGAGASQETWCVHGDLPTENRRKQRISLPLAHLVRREHLRCRIAFFGRISGASRAHLPIREDEPWF
jgi:hypothetical protein